MGDSLLDGVLVSIAVNLIGRSLGEMYGASDLKILSARAAF